MQRKFFAIAATFVATFAPIVIMPSALTAQNVVDVNAPGTWHSDGDHAYNRAYKFAAKKNRLVFIYVGTPTCPICGPFKNEVLNSVTVTNRLRKHFLVEYNYETYDGDNNPRNDDTPTKLRRAAAKIAERRGLSEADEASWPAGWPIVYVMQRNGDSFEVIDYMYGRREPDQFVSKAERILNSAIAQNE